MSSSDASATKVSVLLCTEVVSPQGNPYHILKKGDKIKETNLK